MKPNRTEVAASIVILSALRWNSTRQCIESIRAGTEGVDYEIVVVDMGGCPEAEAGLRRLATDDPRLKLVMNGANAGTSRGRNLGIARACGRHFVFLDNDTLVRPGWLAALLDAAARRPDAGLFGGKLVCPNGFIYFCNRYIHDCVRGDRRFVGVKVTEPFNERDPRVNIEEDVPWYPTGCLLGRRDEIVSIGGFNEELRFIEEDKDLSLRMKQAGRGIVYVPACEVVHDRVKDPLYDSSIRFRNLEQMKEDLRRFETKWNCAVELIYSKQCLAIVGYSDAMIEDMRNGELRKFFTVVD